MVTGNWGRGVVGVHGQLCFLRLTELLASEPDIKGGDSPASVTGGWVDGCAWGGHVCNVLIMRSGSEKT